MGKPVTVDSDDLDAILMITGIAKDFEKLINAQKEDPFVYYDESKIRRAHERLSAEWRRATREVNPLFNDPVSDKATTLLRKLISNGCHEVDKSVMKLTLYQELFIKGMIEYGDLYEVVHWGSTRNHQYLNRAPRLLIRVSPRGKLLLEELNNNKVQ